VGDLWPEAQDAGLAVTFNGTAVSHRIDSFVGTGVLGNSDLLPADVISSYSERDPDLVRLVPATNGRARIRWEGEVWAESGVYTMELRTDAHALLWIDGGLTLNLCANPPVRPDVPIVGNIRPVTSRIDLSPGWHKVRLDYEATGNINGLEWTWTRPDGIREIVPPERLRHGDSVTPGGVSWPEMPVEIACGR
jgi:hypothetical protein